MILYVNGDSHAAAAEATNSYAWACDDGMFWQRGREPHPDNAKVSFGCELANHLCAELELQAQAGCSNTRIMRTTREWIDHNPDLVDQCFMVIQWTTWEREEWWYHGQDYQVNASGIDSVPSQLQSRYQQFVIDIDWTKCQQQAHEDIWQFHCELDSKQIRHVMFNGNNHFAEIEQKRDWGASYIEPYDPTKTYDSVLRQQGFATVNPKSWHFGAKAHCFWAQYLLQYINNNQLL